MSFRCARCAVAFPNPSAPDECRPNLVVTATRVRRYKLETDVGYVLGWEIAKEQRICSGCLTVHTPPTVLLTDEADKENHVHAG